MTMKIFRILSLILLSHCLGGCEGNKTEHWREEVRLPSGEVVTISVVRTYHYGGEWAHPQFRLDAWEIEIEDSGAIPWRARGLEPIVLGKSKDGFWIISNYNSCPAVRPGERVESAYAAHKLSNKEWQAIPIGEFAHEYGRNMMPTMPQGGFMSIGGKDARMGDALYGLAPTGKGYFFNQDSGCMRSYKADK